MANLGIGQVSNLGLVYQAKEFGKLMSIFWYQERASPVDPVGIIVSCGTDGVRPRRGASLLGRPTGYEKKLDKCPDLGLIYGSDRRRTRV
jgi:hypothetical protein